MNRKTVKVQNAEKNKVNIPKEGLDTPIQFCPKVGPSRAASFEKLDIHTVRDLLWHIPRRYEDFHSRVPIRHLQPGQVATVLGKVVNREDRLPRSKSKVHHIFQVVVEDQSGAMQVVWFNQPYLENIIHNGETLLLHGKVDLYDHYLQMSSPKFKIVEGSDELYSEIQPIYPLSEGLSQAVLRKIIHNALDRFDSCLKEFLPRFILEPHNFPDRAHTFRILHHPQPGEGAPTDIDISLPDNLQDDLLKENQEFRQSSINAESLWCKARERLIFEEFFLHQFILLRYRAKIKKIEGLSHTPPHPDPLSEQIFADLDYDSPSHWPAIFLKHLPFELTLDQQRVCREIQYDMCSSLPMNRLLQGDVGSGKTVVSLYAMILSVASGYQAALMAPTEILAHQHAATIKKLTEGIPQLMVSVLTSGAGARESKATLESIAEGSTHIVVGTQALFQERVEFSRLGLVVVDEQHKFGVNQRQKLLEKGIHPDLLVATATPIPRTLSLAMFGDMDNSVIRSLPPGRPPLITRWTTWENERKVWKFVDEKIEAGQQAYVVCPIIESSENLPNLPSTDELFERLTKTFLPHRRVESLHGRLSPETKSELMSQIREGYVDVVVATSVIEVGVDLPNATVIVILGAERFGLAQLHQLRGRVGRGTIKSYCILVTHFTISEVAEHRMRALEQTRGGFKIAEEDLKLRGPGEFFGTKQSGHLKFKIGDPLNDRDLLKNAHRAAQEMYQRDPELRQDENKPLKKELLHAYKSHNFHRPS